MKSNPVRLAIFRRDLMGGGAERNIVVLANHFAESGIKVDLVLSRAEGPLLERVSERVMILDLKASELDKQRTIQLPSSFSSIQSLPKLVSYLRTKRPTALFSASHYSNEIAILAKYLSRVSTRVVVSERIALSEQATQVEQVSSRLTPFFSRLLYPKADGIIAVSDGVAQDLIKITGIAPQKVKVIYNPVITPELTKNSRYKVDHSWFAPGEPPVILGVGRLVKQKDFSTLIRAFAQVQTQQPARLVILGSGRDKEKLQSLIRDLQLEDKATLLGFVQNPYAYMAQASVFVLSSAWEGLPTVLIEAMAVGTPVVSTNCKSGPVEILDNGKYGELVPVGDVQAMANAILKVLSGTIKMVDSTWLQQFTLETAIDEYIKILGI